LRRRHMTTPATIGEPNETAALSRIGHFGPHQGCLPPRQRSPPRATPASPRGFRAAIRHACFVRARIPAFLAARMEAGKWNYFGCPPARSSLGQKTALNGPARPWRADDSRCGSASGVRSGRNHHGPMGLVMPKTRIACSAWRKPHPVFRLCHCRLRSMTPQPVNIRRLGDGGFARPDAF
jgi:hypothetical protein